MDGGRSGRESHAAAGDIEVLIYHPELAGEYAARIRQCEPGLRLAVCATPEEAARAVERADIVFASVTFPTALFARAKRLKWVQVMGAGVERFVLAESALPPDVSLTRVVGSFGERMAEYVLAYMLAITQLTRRAMENQRAHRWEPFRPKYLRGLTLGVAGLGSVGRKVAELAAAVGMRIVAFDLDLDRARGCPAVAAAYGPGRLEAFCAACDFLCLCLPVTERTVGLIGRDELRAMKRDAYIINIARGPLIRERELVEELGRGTIAGAVLDVLCAEPPDPHDPLWDMAGAYLTPHSAGPSLPDEVLAVFFANLDHWRAGQSLLHVVDRERGF